MINKVIYIGYQPLTEKVREDFYFKNLIDNGYKVEYWDLTEIYFGRFGNEELDEEFIIKFNSYDQIKKNIKTLNIDNILFISNITFEYRSLKLYMLLSKYKCKTSFFARGALPSLTGDLKVMNLFLKLRKIFDKEKITRYLKNKWTFILKVNGFVSPHFIVFKAGEMGLQTVGLANNVESKKSKIIEINSFDLEKYKECLNIDKLIDSKYCVYLDDYLPFHPDFELLNIKTVEPIEFYDKLNHIFQVFEKKYNVEVVVAAHPKAIKYKETDFFNGRKIFFNQTAQLTFHSEFLIVHCSTSISFAVLNKKSIISLTTNSLRETMPYYYNFISDFSKTLDTNLINIDDYNLDNLDIRESNIDKYLDFKYKYLTSKESENRLSSEIFIQAISEL